MSSNLKLPPDQQQILILGWPKTASSSVFKWLADHPQIFCSNIEESFLFIDQENPYFNRRGFSVQKNGIEKFFELFKGSNKKQVWLEGTTHSVYQDYMMNFVSQNMESTNAIMILREPVARIFSSFIASQNNFSNISKKLTWSKYVESLLDNNMESLRSYYSNLYSFESSKNQLVSSNYAFWIKKWKKVLPDKKLHILFFEDIKSDPRNVMKCLVRDMSLEESFYENYVFDKKNITLNIKYPFIHKFAIKLRPLIKDSFFVNQVKKIYLKKNTVNLKNDLYSEENQDASDKLKKYLKSNVIELSSLLNKDLSDWMKDRKD